MRIWSDDLGEEKPIPVKYAKDGANTSPPLEWADVPKNARELALVFENVTPATQDPFVHWVVYGISPDWSGLPEGFKHKRDPKAPAGVLQGTNGIGNVGYDGPLGSVGRAFRYRFRLLALDEPLDLGPGADRDALLAAAADHIIAEAELRTHYERPS